MRHFFVILLLAPLVVATVLAQPAGGGLEKLSLDEGTSLHLTYDFIQDRQGFLWFGTMHGLLRYDGIRYQVFRNDPGNHSTLSHDDVITLHQDPNGYLWVGTWGGGLNCLDPGTGKVIRMNRLSRQFAALNNTEEAWAVTSTLSGDTTSVWIAGGQYGLTEIRYLPGDSLQLLQAKTHVITAENGDSIAYVADVAGDAFGQLWIATDSGPFYGQIKNGGLTFRAVSSTARIDVSNISAGRKIFIGASGTIWLPGKAGQLFFIDRANSKSGTISGELTVSVFAKTRLNFVHSLLEDQQGNLWLGTSGGPLVRQRGETQFSTLHSDTNDSRQSATRPVSLLMQDRSGVVWIASYGHGIYKWVPGHQPFFTIGGIPAADQPKAIAAPGNGDIWVADNSGLRQYSPGAAGSGIHHEKLPLQYPSSLAISTDRQGGTVIWIGTSYSGLYQYWPESKRFRHFTRQQDDSLTLPANRITSLYNQGDSILWIGSVAGIARITLPDGQIKRMPWLKDDEKSRWILRFFADQDNTLWVGTYGGLARIAPDRQSLQVYRHNDENPASLSNNYVYSILRTTKKELWIGTGNGLNRLDEGDNTFHRLFEGDGLPNSVICAMLESADGNLWLSTQKGIAVFDGSRFFTFNRHNGLAGNLFLPGVAARDDKGNLYFGSIDGINGLAPRLLNAATTAAPEVAIATVTYDGVDHFSPSQLPELPHDHGPLLFKLAAFDYHAPLANRFEVRLKGLDSAFVATDYPARVSYRHLPPGDYLLEARAIGHSGIVGTDIAQFAFSVTPPFWLSWWFLLGLTLILVAAIAQYHHHKVRRKVRELLLVERARQHERELVREKTARDYHDELGHQITKISLYGELIRRELNIVRERGKQLSFTAPGQYQPELAETPSSPVLLYLHKITHASTALCQNARDFIWALHPEKDSLQDVYQRLILFGEELFEESDMHFASHSQNADVFDIHLPMDFRRHMTLIFKEAMTNALRHSYASKVSLQLRVQEKRISLLLRDNGTGFDSALSIKSGLQNMRKRADQLQAPLLIDSSAQGTIIELQIEVPALKEHEYLNGDIQ